MKFWNAAFFGSALLIAGSLLASINEKDKQTEDAIKKGEVTLKCEFSDGVRTIPAHKFVEIDEINGKTIFRFTNGQARNCWLER